MTKNSANNVFKKVTHVTIADADVLYIYCDLGVEARPMSYKKHMAEEIRKAFEEQFPGTKIIVGFHDLKFTAITKKQQFGEKLAGNLS